MPQQFSAEHPIAMNERIISMSTLPANLTAASASIARDDANFRFSRRNLLLASTAAAAAPAFGGALVESAQAQIGKPAMPRGRLPWKRF